MTIRVGINGFGRIGRLVFRAAQERNDIEIVGINDLIDVKYMAYMLRYDTMHGQFKGSVEVKDGKLVVNGKSIRVTAEKDPANLKWNEVGADYVVESTGLFLTKEKLRAILPPEPNMLLCLHRLKMIRRCLSAVSTPILMLREPSLFPTLPALRTAWPRLPRF